MSSSAKITVVTFGQNWAMPFAMQLAAGEKLTLEVSDFARKSSGQALEEALMLDQLKSLGTDPLVSDLKTIMVGEQQLQRFIQDEVRRAVEKALAEASQRMGMSEGLSQRLTATLPDPAMAEVRTFHEALKAYCQNVETTGKRQDNGKLAPSPCNYLRWAKQLQAETLDFPLWELDKTRLEEIVAHYRNRPKSSSTGNRISRGLRKAPAGRIMVSA